MNPIRVFIFDEHQPSRTLASRVIKSAPGIVLVGEATSPFTIRKAINDCKPDVLALNSTSRLSRHFDNLSNSIHVPVVHIPQPDMDYCWHSIELHKVQYGKFSSDLINSIKRAVNQGVNKSGAKLKGGDPAGLKRSDQLVRKPVFIPRERKPMVGQGEHPLVVIGAPGGDLDALRVVLLGLQPESTGILIAQQIPAFFDQHYMESLSSISLLPVMKAAEGQAIEPEKILLVPSEQNIEVVKKGDSYCCHLSGCDNTPGRKPSLDLLFSSLAENAGSMGIGILVLGAGSEGTKGLSRLRKAGANILVQENESPHSEPMPSAAIMNGGAELIVPLNSIATEVAQIISGYSSKAV